MNLSYSWRTLLVYMPLPAKKIQVNGQNAVDDASLFLMDQGNVFSFLLIGLLHSPVEYSDGILLGLVENDARQ